MPKKPQKKEWRESGREGMKSDPSDERCEGCRETEGESPSTGAEVKLPAGVSLEVENE